MNRPLCTAATNGHFEIVKYLAETGADLEAKDFYSGTPSLPCAVFENIIEIVKYLIDKKCNIYVKSYWDITSLHAAAGSYNLYLVDHLLENGAELEVRDEQNGLTPLHYVAERCLSNTYPSFSRDYARFYLNVIII
jgi:ankyrin repeat protein